MNASSVCLTSISLLSISKCYIVSHVSRNSPCNCLAREAWACDHEVKSCATMNDTANATERRPNANDRTPSFDAVGGTTGCRVGDMEDVTPSVEGVPREGKIVASVGNGVVGYFVDGVDDEVCRVGKGVVGYLVDAVSPPSAVSGLGNGVVGVGKGVDSSEVFGLGASVCSVGKGVVGDFTEAAVGMSEEAVLSESALVKSLLYEKKSVVG